MSARSLAVAGALALLGANALPSQTPTLVADLDKTPPTNQSTNPIDLVIFRGALYYSGFTHATGYELFRMTGGQPTLVKDVQPGVAPSYPKSLTVVGNQLFFVANLIELWVSDGTANGTQRLRRRANNSKRPHALTAAGNRLYFQEGDERSPGDLWTSDGTAAGTRLLRAGVARPELRMHAVGSRLYFVGYQTSTGYELWRSDGTTTTTVLVKDIQPGSGASRIHSFGTLGTRIVFLADSPSSTAHWISDGTTAGTKVLVDTNGPLNGGFGTNRVMLGTRLYFGATETASFAGGLWATGGTPATTTRIVRTLTTPTGLILHGGRLYFIAEGSLWISDGTSTGTKKLFGLPSTVSLLHSTNTHLFYASSRRTSAGTITTLFATPGTTNPVLLANFWNIGYPTAVSIPGTLYFRGSDPTAKGTELWRSNGTAGGTRPVFDYQSPKRFTLGSYATANVGLDEFAAGESNRGVLLSDGTPAGTSMLGGVAARVSSATLDGSPYVSEVGLDRIDPVTKKRTTIYPKRVAAMFRFGGELFFVTTDGFNIFRTDGTAAGTKLVKKVGPAVWSSRSHVVYKGAIYAVIYSGHGQRLWRIDGTTTGTHEVKVHNTPYFQVNEVAVLGRHLMVATVRGLLRSDGTAAGTSTVSSVTFYGRPVVLGGVMYFLSTAPNTRGLWRTDGTTNGTTRVRALIPGTKLSPWSELIAHRGALYFVVNNAATGAELWTSDGTAAGTKIVKDVFPGTGGIDQLSVAHLRSAGAYLYFAANDGVHGMELWRTDGTAAGTTMVHDLNRGTAGSRPHGLYVRRGELWFTADDGVVGHELWRVDVGPIALPVGHGCAAKGTPPQLAATSPKLGSRMTFDVTNIASSARAAVLAFGIGVRRQTYLGAGCALHVDFGLPTIVQYLTPRNGTAQLSLTVPTVPSLHGALVPAQAAVGPTGNVPLGVDLSHGLFLAFRR